VADAVIGYQINANASGALGAFRALKSAIADSVQAARGLNSAIDPSKMGDGGFQLSQQFDAMQNAGSRIAGFGQAMTAPIVGFATAALDAGMTFEASMNKVASLARIDLGGSAFQQLENEAIRLGSSTKYSASQVADAMGFLAMAGFDQNDITQSTEGVLALATAGDVDLANAADIASDILSGYSANLDDSMSKAEQLAYANDILANTFTRSNTDLSQLGYAFKYVAPVAANAGISMEQASAALGILADSGRKGSQGGTDLRGFILDLMAPSEKATKVFEGLGVAQQNFLDSQGNFNLENALSELAKFDLNESQLKDIFGQTGITGAQILIGDTLLGAQSKLKSLTEQNFNATGSAAAIAEKQMQGLKGAIDTIKSATEGLFIAIGKTGLQSTIAGVIHFLARIIQAISKLNPFILRIGVAIAAIVAGLGVVITVLGTVIMFVGAVGAALTTLAAPATIAVMGAAIAGIGTVASGVAATITGLGAAISGVFTMSLPAMLGAIGGGIAAAAGAIGTFVTATLLPALPIIAGIAITALLIRKYWEPIKVFFASVGKGFMEGLKPAIDIVGEAFAQLRDAFMPVFQILGISFDLASDQAHGSFTAVEEFGRRVGQVIGFLVGIPVYIVDSLRLFVSDVLGLVGKLNVPFAPGFDFGDVGTQYTALLESVTGRSVGNLSEAISAIVQAYSDGFGYFFAAIDSQLGTSTGNPVEAIRTVAVGYVEAFNGIIGGTFSGIQSRILLLRVGMAGWMTQLWVNFSTFWLGVGYTVQGWWIQTQAIASMAWTNVVAFWQGVGFTIQGWWIQTQALASMGWANVVTFWQGVGYTIRGWWIQTQALASIAWAQAVDLWTNLTDWVVNIREQVVSKATAFGNKILELIQAIQSAFSGALNSARSAISNLNPFRGGGGASGTAVASAMMPTAPVPTATGATTSSTNTAMTNTANNNSIQTGDFIVSSTDPQGAASEIQSMINGLFGQAQQSQLSG